MVLEKTKLNGRKWKSSIQFQCDQIYYKNKQLADFFLSKYKSRNILGLKQEEMFKKKLKI